MAYNKDGVFEATDQQSVSFLESTAAKVESRIRREMLAKVKYPEIIYVDTESMGVADDTLISYIGRPGTGRMTPLSNGGMDLPRVEVEYDRITRQAYASGIAYGWDDMEVEVAMNSRRPLQSDRVQAAFEVAEREKESVVLHGRPDLGWPGLITNQPTDTSNAALFNTVASQSAWSAGNTRVAYSAIRAAFSKIYADTKQVVMPDTLLLPVAAGNFLFEPMEDASGVSMTATSIYQYLKENNPYTMMTGQPLRIILINELDTAGSGNSPLGIMYSSSQDAARFIVAQDLTFIGPQRQAFAQTFYGRMKLGGVQFLMPKAFCNITGIGTTP